MTAAHAALKALDRVKARYEDDGYELSLEHRLTPPFDGFVADAVARRAGETVVIEALRRRFGIRRHRGSRGTREGQLLLGEQRSTGRGGRLTSLGGTHEYVTKVMSNDSCCQRPRSIAAVPRAPTGLWSISTQFLPSTATTAPPN